jgi:predicted membrane-bound spermidine synthase
MKEKKNFLLFLSFLSGTSGIAYEVLYSRIFSSYFGEVFYVYALILITVLVGVGLGSLYAKRYLSKLWFFELSLGIYAIFFSLFLSSGFFIVFLSSILSLQFLGTILSLLFLFVLLFIPSFLIGFSIPLFTLYLSKTDSFHSFKKIYSLYNLGAVLSILCVEFFLIKYIGMQYALFCFALINLLIAFILKKYYLFSSEKKKSFSILWTFFQTLKKERLLQYLILFSCLSAMFQLFFLKFIGTLFGAFHENFALLLALNFLGLSIGAFFSKFKKLSFHKALTYFPYFFIFIFILTTPLVYFWAFLNDYFFWSELGRAFTSFDFFFNDILKFITISLFGLVPFAFFGSLIPLIKKEKKEFNSGFLLAISSFANALGYLLYIFLFHQHLSFLGILLLFSFFFFLILILEKRKIYSLLFFMFLVFFLVFSWPHSFIESGFKSLDTIDELNLIKEQEIISNSYKKYGDEIRVNEIQGNKYLLFNGYKSLQFGENQTTELREALHGIYPSFFSSDRESALVIGFGTGVTGSYASESYDLVRIVELSPAVVESSEQFKEENLNILEKENIDLLIQDGVHELLSSEQNYDVIINTVSSPVYFYAGKLWSQDFYQVISSKLKEGGVFSAWVDFTLGKEGLFIVLNTLETSFEDCRYFFLSDGYYNVICSNEKLSFKKREDFDLSISIQNLFENYSIEKNYSSFIKGAEIDFTSFEEEYEKREINTLDKPVLDFIDYRSFYIELSSGEAIELLNLFPKDLEFEDSRKITEEQRCKSFIALNRYISYEECLERMEK